MITYMKRQHLILIGVGILAILCILLLSKTKLSSSLILDKLNAKSPEITLYYSDISGKKIKPYRLYNNNVTPLENKYIAYTEGFLPKSKYSFYMNILSEFANSQGISLPSSLHDFYEDDRFVVMSFSGNLDDIYVIEKNNLRVHTLSYKEQLDLGPMYISHVQVVDDLLILLGGEANSYNAFVYKVYLPTFEVVDAIRLAVHPSAISDKHFTLTSDGQAAFINGTNLKVYDILEDTYQLIFLDLEATDVISINNTLIALGNSSSGTSYSVIDTTQDSIITQTLTLPATTCQVVKLLADSNYLYIISYDPQYKRFMNYLSIYEISTGNLVYTLGLTSHQPYALLNGDLLR